MISTLRHSELTPLYLPGVSCGLVEAFISEEYGVLYNSEVVPIQIYALLELSYHESLEKETQNVTTIAVHPTSKR